METCGQGHVLGLETGTIKEFISGTPLASSPIIQGALKHGTRIWH